ncbi:MAG TPA: Gfo/Idh/MocA family oxidoreductase [Verrucomicrobiae bacterium]|jgi:glucose-fructose oxidoreductase|nr:Gfo/Idh/MocA family oxidoreductase [Verrucomicrobiae bacterium]
MRRGKQIRYAVVGLGHIAQTAVLPAFRHARRNSTLAALVSDDPEKLAQLSRRYDVDLVYSYDEYDECLRSGEVDAVYIALPNNLHRDFAVRAARAGVHILCEKPMAVTAADCRAMIRAARDNRVKLMVAYRLHFEAANLKAVEIAKSGKIGDTRLFHSVFAMQVKEENIRTQAELGGGTLYDLGIYCINAARYIFQAEPYEVLAASARSDDPRFQEIDEMTSAVLRFPENRLAVFSSSFGGADASMYEIVGTRGKLRLEPAYEYAMGLNHELTVSGKTTKRHFPKRDQFAAELLYFSNCVQKNLQPEPSGEEGLADVGIIEALYQSAATGRAVALRSIARRRRPTMRQEIKRPAIPRPPELVHAESASG